MTDIALDFKEETASVNRLGESLRQLKIAADAANQSSLDKLRGAIKSLGISSKDQLQQIAADTRSILQRLQQEVRQSALSSAHDTTVALQAEVVRQAENQVIATKAAVLAAKQAAAEIKSIRDGAGTATNRAVNPIHPKAIADTNALNTATIFLAGSHKIMNDGLRGLVQSLGMYSSTLTAILPMFAGMAIGAGFVKSLKVGSEFEQSMFVIQEIAGTSIKDIGKLKESILALGATTQYGPLEVAKGLETLTLAGLSAKDALAAIQPVLHFAATGGVTLKEGAETLVAVSVAYKYSAANIETVGDILAKTAADTMASVTDMSAAFKMSTVVAQQYGMSLDDTATALGMLAQIGIRGTAAGTSYRNMLTEFNKGSGKAADGIKLLGVEIKTAEGGAKDLMSIMKEASSGLITKDVKSQSRLLDDIANERGGKSLAAFQAAFLVELNKTNPLLQEEADLLRKSGKEQEANKVLTDAVTAAYEKMSEKVKESINSAAGFTFFANLEEQFTSLSSYKGILASLGTDFIKAFDGASDSAKLLGMSLRESLNSVEFQSALSSVVTGMLKLATGIVDITKFLADQTQVVVAAAGAYFLLGTNVGRFIAFSLPAYLISVASSTALVGTAVADVTALAGLFSVSFGTAAVAIGGTVAAVGALVAALGYLVFFRDSEAEAVAKAEAIKREEYIKTHSVTVELLGKTITAQQDAIDTELVRVSKLNAVSVNNRVLDAQARALDWQALHAEGGKKSELGQRLHKEAEELRAKKISADEAMQKIAGEAMQARIVMWGEERLRIEAATKAQAVLNNMGFSGGFQSRTVAEHWAGQESDTNVKKINAETEAALAKAKATSAALLAAKQQQKALADADAAASKVKPYGTEVGGYTGNSLGRTPRVEKYKLETSNIAEEQAKRNKIILDAEKAEATNAKTVLDAKLAADLISKSRYAAEMQQMEDKTSADAVASIIQQQTARLAAYKAADTKVLETQEEFHKRNAGNAAALGEYDRSIAKVRENNLNKYVTESQAATYSVKAILDKAATEAEVAESKHQGELRKIRKDALDWEVSESELKLKNARALATAEASRSATPIQAAVIAAEAAEFERLTANANKFDAQIEELTKSTEKYEDARKKGLTLGETEAKANKKELDLLDEFSKRKSALTGGIPIEIKLKGAEAAATFIQNDVVRIRNSLNEAILGAGKDGGKALRDVLESELVAKPLKLFIETNFLQPVTQGIAQAIAGQTLGAGAGTGIFGALSAAMSGVSLAASKFGTAVMTSASEIAGGTLTFTQGLSAAGSLVGSGSYAAGLGTAVGSVVPYIPHIAAAIAAAKGVEALTTINVADVGKFLYGYNTATGFKSGGRQDYMQEGAWRGSTKNSSWFDPAPQVSQYMSAVNDAVITGVKDWAGAIGLSAGAVDSYSKQIEVSIGGLDAKGMKDAIDKAFAGMADDIAQMNFGDFLLPLSRDGETLGATLQRLGADLTTVNGILAGLNKPLFDATMQGVQDMEAFLASIGGLDKFGALVSNLEAVNGVMLDLGQATFDVTLEGARAAQTLALSVGGVDKLSTMAASLIKVNENLGKLGEPLQDISVAGAKAAQSMLKATEVAVKTKEAADKLNTDANNFSKNLLTANGKSTTSALQKIFEQAMTEVAKAIPALVDWNAISKVTPEAYMGYSASDRSKLDAAVSAYSDLSSAIKTSADAATATAKTAQDAADTAVKAYEDALAAIEKSTRDASREIADFGKTDFQKALSKIDYSARDKQAELDALSSKAAALSAEATAASLKASNASLDSTGTLTEGLILYSATVKDNSREVVANISETLQNTTQALGDSLTLVPAIAALFAEILKGLEKIPTALQAVSAAVSGLGSASSSAAGGVSSLAMASAAAGTSAAGATPSVTAMGGAFNAVAPAATAAGTALNSLGSSFDAAGAALNSLGGAFDTAATALGSLTSTFGAAAGALDGLNTSFNSAATGLSSLSSAFDSVAGSGADFAGTLTSVGGAFFSASSAAASAAGGISSAVAALSSAASAASSISPAAPTSPPANVLTKAGGGAIYGPGTSISDDIPAMLSNGEYVIKAASVSKYGVRFMDALNAGQLKNTVYRYTGTPLSNPLVTLTETEKTAVYLQKFADVVGQLGGVLQRVEGTADTSTKINVLNPETLSQALSKITSIPISDTNSKPRFDISGKDAAGVSQYFLDLLKANPPTQDSSGNLSFSADAAKALGPLADVLDSVNTVITRLKEQQGWQDKLAVLSGKKLQEEIDLQSELANATDDATKSLIKQVYAQEQQKKADDKVLGLRGSSAQLLVDDVRLKGDRFTADAMQRQLDLYGADGKSGITAGLTAEGKGQVVAQYDLNAKYKAQIASDTAILEAQKAAQEHYLDTIDKVTEAQKKYASTLTSTIKGFKDFLKTLDVKSATGSDLRSSRTSFNELAKQAAAGDTSVYEKLVPAAQEMLDLSTKYSKTLQEYRRDEANVRNVLNSVIDKSQEQLDKLPDVSLEGDAIKTAWQDLQKATTAQANASVLLAAMGVDQADILTRRRTAEEALIKQYEDAIKLRPDYAQFQVEFNNKIVELKDSSLVPEIGDTFKLPEGTTVETLITDRLDMLLPTEGVTPINFVKVFTDRVGLILPDGFAGDEIDLALMLTTKVNGILPDNMAGEGFKLAEMLTTRVGVMMPTNFAGPEFNAKTIVSDQLTKVVMPDTMAGAPFNAKTIVSDQITKVVMPDTMAGPGFSAKTIVSDQITKVVMPDAMAGPTFSAKTIVSDQVTEVVLRKGFAGPEFSLVGIATARLYNDILPANFAGVAFNAQAVFYTRLSEILPVNIGGDSFNAAQMMQAAIDRAVASSATAVAGTTTATSTSGNSSSYTRPFEAVSLDYDLERARDYARRALGLPSFAVGTSYVPYDMTANIHEGEEITPRPYVDAQRSDREQTNALLVRLIKSNEAMQAELAQLRASAAATAASTKNTERVLVRVSRDGNSLLTTPA